MKLKTALLMVFLITNIWSKGQYWDYTAGNNTTFDGILGLTSNYNIDFQTNGVTRMSLMRTGTTAINGYNINTSGFWGLDGKLCLREPQITAPLDEALEANGICTCE